jgi:hypothetical protein
MTVNVDGETSSRWATRLPRGGEKRNELSGAGVESWEKKMRELVMRMRLV